jgi:hypothetical protein
MDISLPGVCAAISAERHGELIIIPDTRKATELAEWRRHAYAEPWPLGSAWRATRS